MFEGDAVHELHGNERLVAMLADFVDSANVGVIERRSGAGLAAKAFEGQRVARKLVRQELEGDEAAELGVFGFIDHAHAAIAQLFEDAVVRDGLIDHPGDLTFVASSYGREVGPSTNGSGQ